MKKWTYEKTCDDIYLLKPACEKTCEKHVKTSSKFDSACWMLIWSYSIRTYHTSKMKLFHLVVALSHSKIAGYESAKKISACLFLESLVVGFLLSLVCNITYSTKQSQVETNVIQKILTKFSYNVFLVQCLKKYSQFLQIIPEKINSRIFLKCCSQPENKNLRKKPPVWNYAL